MATEGFVREMGLKDDSILLGKVQFRELPSGTHLMKEESNKVVTLSSRLLSFNTKTIFRI